MEWGIIMISCNSKNCSYKRENGFCSAPPSKQKLIVLKLTMGKPYLDIPFECEERVPVPGREDS